MKKLLQFPLVRLIIAILFVGLGIVIGQIALNLLRTVFAITNAAPANLLALILITPITFLAYWLYVRLVERRRLKELSALNALSEFGHGSLIGFGLFTLVIAILGLLGFYRVSGIDFVLLTLIGALAGAFVSAFAQELIFRAAIYRITEEWLGTWWAIAISAILFGLIHLSSAAATLFSALAIALQAGVLLAAAYTLTHRLWMALGLHMAWDFANDGIFGVGVAGQSGQSLPGLFHASINGPDLFTGGVLGVEASVITFVIMLLAGSFFLRMAYQKGYFVSRKNKSLQVKMRTISSKFE